MTYIISEPCSWDDGHTTVFAPSAGVARIEARKQKGKG